MVQSLLRTDRLSDGGHLQFSSQLLLSRQRKTTGRGIQSGLRRRYEKVEMRGTKDRDSDRNREKKNRDKLIHRQTNRQTTRRSDRQKKIEKKGDREKDRESRKEGHRKGAMERYKYSERWVER